MRPEVATERLRLRRGAPEDFDAIHEVYSFPQVARMVGTWPVPSDPERTRKVCEPVPVERGIAGPILLGDQIIGNMGCLDVGDGVFNMGFGLHPDHWGQGFATEMGRELVDAIFARYPASVIEAGHWVDNPASGRVLKKLGFRRVRNGFSWCVGRQQAVEIWHYQLTREDWLAANPLRVETERLIIRSYDLSDIPALHEILSQERVARMVASVPHPIDLPGVQQWVSARQYQGRAGFCAGIFSKDGTLIGNLGLAPGGASIMFLVDPAQWGSGYATEAMRGFLGWAFDRFALIETGACHFTDNSASGRVLQKLGFRQTGNCVGESMARLEPEPVIAYRLSRDRFEALT